MQPQPQSNSSDLQRTWETAQADYLLVVQARSGARNVYYNKTQLTGIVRWACSEKIALADFAARHFRRFLVYRAEQGISDRTRHVLLTESETGS